MRFKRFIATIFILLFTFTTTAFGTTTSNIAYTALGDSISVGIGATENYGHVKMLENHLLRTHTTVDFNDYSTSGQTSFQLLSSLRIDPALQASISQADIITISIGGNDILQPLIAFVAANPLYLNAEYLAAAIANPSEHPQLASLMQMLTANASAFGDNWRRIIGTIRSQNSHATIFVNTLYNPFLGFPVLDAFAEQLLTGINTPIYMGAAPLNYRVVDVYRKFSTYQNPRFPAVHMDLQRYDVLIHPTDRGYLFIFNMHKDLFD